MIGRISLDIIILEYIENCNKWCYTDIALNMKNRTEVMMFELGVDIIEIDRIKSAIEKNSRFLDRIFTVDEQAYFKDNKSKYESIAGMYAAKEAVSKVLGTGISGFTWHDIEIGHTAKGQPIVTLTGGAKDIADQLSINMIKISISHCKSYAVANAIGM